MGRDNILEVNNKTFLKRYFILYMMINVNSKKEEGRVSFSNIRDNHNKENQLSFQNLRRHHRMRGSECSSTYSNQYQNNPPTNIIPLFKNFANKADFNQTSSVKFASRVKEAGRMSSGQKSAWLSAEFNQIQSQIKQKIEQYNRIFNEVIEVLTDMQIRDLMKFNQLLQDNKKILQRSSGNSRGSYHKFTDAKPELIKIKDIQKLITKTLRQPQSSFDFRSTYESKHKKTISPTSSAISPQLTKPNALEKRNSLEDTPESVKSKLSCVSSKLKPQKSADIGMFDRINICQSIVERVSFNNNSFMEDKKKQIKEHHRYGRNSEE